MTETRKLAAILVADIVGYSRLTGADEELTLARLRALRSDLIDPTIAIHNGRVIKRTGDGAFVEFRSVVEAVRCAMEVRSGLAERNAGLPVDKRIEARVGIHLGDVVEESDGDLMGDGVNIAARLEGICEPGCVCLSAAAYEQVRDKLHVTFVDLGEKSLKNIERPVRAYMVRAAEGGAAERLAVTRASRLRLSALQWAAIAVAFLAFLTAAGWFGPRVFAPSPRPSPPIVSTQDKLASAPRLSLVVLPFANLSGDPEQDYFADGLSDDLTTDLSHLPGSFVIAHNTALTYKGKAVDVKEIGRELGVRYAVEGSVRRVGEMITVNAQLISTETGAHVWADRFEGERGKLGDLQVEAVARIANALGVQLLQAESLRAIRDRPTNPDAVDLTMRGWVTFAKSISPENVNQAIGFFDQALRLDPDLPQALIGKAQAQLINLYAFQVGDWTEVLHNAEQAVDRVLASTPDNKSALYVKALVSSGRGQYEATLASLDAAIAIDRNFAPAYGEMTHTLVMLGRAEEGVKSAEQALRLDPHSPARNVWEWYLCDVYAHLAQWQKTADWCQKSVASNSSLLFPYIELAAANGWLGRPEEASAAVADLRRLKPGFTVQDYLGLPHPDNAQWKSEDRRIVEGLRKAGLPEGPARMGGGYTNVIAIPVDDPDTKAIAGALFRPQGAGPFPAVIYLGYCASFDSGDERAVQKTLVERLPAKGFATLIVDPYTARGEIYGVCGEADSSDSNARQYALRGAKDAYAALNALAKLPDIDPKRVFLLGYGHAGNAAILATDSHAAANHPLTFAGVVSYWPWCGWGADFPVPTLVLIGEKDDWSPPGLCMAIKDKPNLEVVVLPGATNSFALPGVSDHLGHHTVYDEKATQDAQARTEAFLAAHAK
jgi:adenylate cyclase